MKLHFENLSIFFTQKQTYTLARLPLPFPFVFVHFSMTPFPPQQMYFLNDHLGAWISFLVLGVTTLHITPVLVHFVS